MKRLGLEREICEWKLGKETRSLGRRALWDCLSKETGAGGEK